MTPEQIERTKYLLQFCTIHENRLQIELNKLLQELNITPAPRVGVGIDKSKKGLKNG